MDYTELLPPLPESKARKMRPLHERFWEKVDRQSESGCWEWRGSKGRGGYGLFSVHSPTEGRKSFKAHRFSWLLDNGSIPGGMWVLHKCDNPPCVNPAHLFIGDRRDNMIDCAKKGRICNIGKSRLTHCVRGHEFTPENTHITPRGHRKCITCRRADNRAYKIRAAAIRALPEEP